MADALKPLARPSRRALLRSAGIGLGGLAGLASPVASQAPGATTAGAPTPDAELGPGGSPGHVLSRPAPGTPARRLALALGSGSLHGHALVGVMRVFEQRQVKPDLIVGTSVGAIVGALWAAGVPAAEVEAAGRQFGLLDAAELSWPRRGLLRNDGLQRRLRALLPPQPIEAWPIRFAAVATDLETGERVVLDRGDAPSAIAASACMPVLFEPVVRDGRPLVDGALCEPVPVRAARALGGQRVVGIDIAFRPRDEPVRQVFDTGFQIVHILIHSLIREQLHEADVRVQLDLHDLMRDRRDIQPILVQAGERAAVKHWASIVG
ncbi:MAG: patatin-like phospholipase family protein [Ideonella sp.]|nr:patatin-like phospholipase family protein [Ideonella sp.]